MITVSIVSHGHGEMVEAIILQLRKLTTVSQILLTLNIPEKLNVTSDGVLIIIHNETPLGFGANHNKAFKICSQPYFCVLNPDIQLIADPFQYLLECMNQEKIQLVAPMIVSPLGVDEDSARKFPTLLSIFKKLLFSVEGRWPIDFNKSINYPDWVAGMFMLFNSKVYEQIKGFDTNYFLYYEDVDICLRIREQGHQIGLCLNIKAIHNAQRASRRNLKFMLWHIKSLFRYLFLRSKK